MERIIHSIVPAIEEFLKIPCKDLALLIYGPWGCGKTFFLRHLFKEEWNGKKTIFISLKGISALEDISQEIFLQIAMCKLPKNEKLSKYLSRFPILKMLENIDIPYLKTSGLVQCLDKSVISGVDLTKYIFIFDDLERLSTNIDYKDVLFYIHSLLLEGRSSNVIVVTDKAHLFEETDTSSEQYSQVSNKVFYREIPFTQNIKDIFADYLKKRYPALEVSLYKTLLTASVLEKIFIENTTQNLRYYNQFFDAFFAIWPYFDKIDFPSNEIRQDVLNELWIILWYEYIFLQVTPPSSKAEFMYPFERFSIFPPKYRFVHQFCENGILNVHQLQQEISERLVYYTQREPIGEALNRLNHFDNYSYDEIIEALKSVVQEYPKLNDIDLLFDIYSCLSFLREVGFIPGQEYSKIVSSLRLHIRQVVLASSDGNLLSQSSGHLLCRVNKEIQDFWTQLYKDHKKFLEEKYIKLFLQSDFDNPELLHYCESATPQQKEKLWKQLYENRVHLARQGKLIDLVRFMLHKMPNTILKTKEVDPFIQAYLSEASSPCEIEVLRRWVLRFVAGWGTSCYKKYAAKLKRRSLSLVNQYNKQKKLY